MISERAEVKAGVAFMYGASCGRQVGLPGGGGGESVSSEESDGSAEYESSDGGGSEDSGHGTEEDTDESDAGYLQLESDVNSHEQGQRSLRKS